MENVLSKKRPVFEMHNLREKSGSEFSTPVKTLKGALSNSKNVTPSLIRNTPKEKSFAKLETVNNVNKKDVSTPTRQRLKNVDSSTDVRKICVAVRIRPMNSKEIISGSACPLKVTENEIIVNNCSSTDIAGALATTYAYDHVFWSLEDGVHKFSTQKQVFEELALPLLDAALEGYNACLFTYGQTGSGKTYSMMGCDYTLCGEGSGIIPRFCNELLIQKQKKEFQLSMSYYEIYNEKIHDLLCTSRAVENKECLRVREHPASGPYVENLSRHRVDSLNELNVLLSHGNSRRATSATLHNNHSSRSHAILEICITSAHSGVTVLSKVSLVDLAGSERVASSFVSEERFKEGLSINKSLLTLGKVITSLSDIKRGSFIPYRESVLTWLLKESLGGNSRTVMLATVSPSGLATEETLSTLRYACQARHILNRVAVNEDPQLKLIRELRQEVERLKSLREDHEKNEPQRNDKTSESKKFLIKAERIKYENVLMNIEIKQKAVEEELQTELSRIGMNLEAAEKRKKELESQKDEFFKRMKCEDVPIFESNFFENLQDILNVPKSSLGHPFDDSDRENESVVHLQQINKSLQGLKTLCHNKYSDHRILPLLENMNKCYKELSQILENPSI